MTSSSVPRSSITPSPPSKTSTSRSTGASTSRAWPAPLSNNLVKRRITGGASTITMQLAGNLFLDRSDRSFRRKMQEILLALQIERRYTKAANFLRCTPNQVYLAHGNYGFAAAAQFYFGKPVTDLKLQEAALLAGMVNGPKFSPLTNPELALKPPQSSASSHGRRREDHTAEEASRQEIAARPAHSVSAQRPRALLLRRHS